MSRSTGYDAIIIGGSYAGLSAALSLGRAMREVLIIDAGNPCNRHTPFSHNFLSRDGIDPLELAGIARQEVLEYPTVGFLEDKVVEATGSNGDFRIRTSKNKELSSGKLVFATGVEDLLPDIKGFASCWGSSILHCPYCHGYEFKGAHTGVFGNGEAGYEQVKLISHWAGEIALYTNGPSSLSKEQQENLAKKNIKVEEREIDNFEHVEGNLQNVIFKDNSKQPLKALYASPDTRQKSYLPEKLGCELTEHGRIDVDIFQKTCVPGIYAAGDNSSMGRAVAVAVSAGSVAGTMLNKELIAEEFDV